MRTNERELEKEYSRRFYEGGEGYIPDMKKSSKYKKWMTTEVF